MSLCSAFFPSLSLSLSLSVCLCLILSLSLSVSLCTLFPLVILTVYLLHSLHSICITHLWLPETDHLNFELKLLQDGCSNGRRIGGALIIIPSCAEKIILFPSLHQIIIFMDFFISVYLFSLSGIGGTRRERRILTNWCQGEKTSRLSRLTDTTKARSMAGSR